MTSDREYAEAMEGRAMRNVVVNGEAVLDLARRLLAALDREEKLREAIHEARVQLWWFVERDTGEGWGFADSDIDEIAMRAMRIQDKVLLAPVHPEHGGNKDAAGGGE